MTGKVWICTIIKQILVRSRRKDVNCVRKKRVTLIKKDVTYGRNVRMEELEGGRMVGEVEKRRYEK